MGVRIDLKPGSDRIIYEYVDKKIITLPDGIVIGMPVVKDKQYRTGSCKHDIDTRPHVPVKIDYNTDINNKLSINGRVIQGDLTTDELGINIVNDSLLYVDIEYNLDSNSGFHFVSCSHYYDTIFKAYEDNKIIKTRLHVHNVTEGIDTIVTVDMNFLENGVAYFFPILIVDFGEGLRPYIFRLIVGRNSCNLRYWKLQID